MSAKEKILEFYPEAICKKKGNAYVVYAKPGQRFTTVSKSARRAWEKAVVVLGIN